MAAENFDGNAVERAHPDGIGDVADEIAGAVLHFARGTVGKGDDQTVPRVGFHVGKDISQPGG